MVKVLTSAAANKLLKSYNEQLQHLYSMECQRRTYTEVQGIEPVVPEYDYDATREKINGLCEKIANLKHAINVFNVNTVVGDTEMTIDQLLIRMAQLNREKSTLDVMRSTEPKSMKNSSVLRGSNQVEYIVANYDPKSVQCHYDKLYQLISDLQVQLDTVNTTLTFEFDDKE